MNAGWLKFGAGIGDRRIGFINVAIDKLIGKEQHKIARRSGRQLQVKNEDSTKKYVKLCKQGFMRKKIVEKIQQF